MSTTWSTTVTDWQGVDETPTTESHNLVESGGVFEKISGLGMPYSYKIDFRYPYNDYTLDIPIPSGSIIQSFNGFTGRFIYKEGASGTFVSVSASDCPYTLVKDAAIVRSDVAGNALFTIITKREFYKISDVDNIPVENSKNLLTSGVLFSILGKQFSLFTNRANVVFTSNSTTFKSGKYYIRGIGYLKEIILNDDTTFNFSSDSVFLVYDTVNETFATRSAAGGFTELLFTDIVLLGYDGVSGYMVNSPLYTAYIEQNLSTMSETLTNYIDIKDVIFTQYKCR